ncbi:MAG: polysaccharide lyase family 8 super-sandwich domain-containing protein [Bacteroidales bacterium]|nr:polysaccharide lyase family 8 super-sandwich domain-containing protein [Bacteroidales bacterium]
MLFRKSAVLAIVLCVVLSISAATNKDIEKLRKIFSTEYLSGRFDTERVKVLMNTIQTDGTWANINYIDTARVAFQHTEHLSNLRQMALAYKQKGSPLKGNKQLKQKFDLALNHWIEKDYICENWWNNQIGTPSTMVALLYVMDTDLSKAQVEGMLRIAGRANMSASGARPSGDRAKIANLQAEYSLWSRNASLVEESIRIIEGEAKFSGEENTAVTAEGIVAVKYFSGGRGLQRDYSFHHRPDRVNNTSSYGMGPINAFVNWAIKLVGTQYQFSEEKTRVIIDYYLDGQVKQQIFGRIYDPNTTNRSASTMGGSRTNVVGTSIPEQLMKLSDYRKAELQQVIDARQGDLSNTPSFAKFFWQTEHFAIQRPTWYASVRMFSTRNMNMEWPYNGEGLLNHYRADGTNYLSKSGVEYDRIAPVFDFRKVPGATIVQKDSMPSEDEVQKSGTMDFVGAVTDGLYGAVAFDFTSPHDPLSVKKGWFFFDDVYVCLGADIRGNNAATTLNQCKLNGAVTVKTSEGKQVKANGSYDLANLQWVNHDNVGYVFLDEAQSAGLFNREVTGNWQRVNRQTTVSRELVRDNIFALWVNHNALHSYAYAVLPTATAEQTETFYAKPQVKVLANTKQIQAVSNDKLGIAYAIFYTGGKIKLTEGIELGSDTPGIVMVKYAGNDVKSITVEDPTRKLLKMHITVNGKPSAIVLPQGDYAGQSATL